MQRYFMELSYDGRNYHGWQVQPNGASVQGCLAGALSLLLRAETEVVGAGRTDAGVHAARMVAHFDSDCPFDPAWLAAKLNRLLPPDIAVHGIRRVREGAHARFDALSRTYRYHVATAKLPFRRDWAWRVAPGLDFGRMNEAAAVLREYTDFTSFSKLHTDVKTNNCRVMQAEWMPEGEAEWVFTIRADRFLRNMVRAVVGTLMDVGRGKMGVDGFRAVVEAKDRCRAGSSAPAHGLFLADVEYPADLYIM